MLAFSRKKACRLLTTDPHQVVLPESVAEAIFSRGSNEFVYENHGEHGGFHREDREVIS